MILITFGFFQNPLISPKNRPKLLIFTKNAVTENLCWWHYNDRHQHRCYQTYMFSFSWDTGLGTGRPQCPHWPIRSEFFFCTFSNIILNILLNTPTHWNRPKNFKYRIKGSPGIFIIECRGDTDRSSKIDILTLDYP